MYPATSIVTLLLLSTYACLALASPVPFATDIHIREASNPGGEVPKLLRRLDLPRDVTQWQNEDGEVGHIYERDPESEPLNARFFRNLKFKIQRKVGGAGWYVAQHLHQHNMYHPPRDLQAEEDFQ